MQMGIQRPQHPSGVWQRPYHQAGRLVMIHFSKKKIFEALQRWNPTRWRWNQWGNPSNSWLCASHLLSFQRSSWYPHVTEVTVSQPWPTCSAPMSEEWICQWSQHPRCLPMSSAMIRWWHQQQFLGCRTSEVFNLFFRFLAVRAVSPCFLWMTVLGSICLLWLEKVRRWQCNYIPRWCMPNLCGFKNVADLRHLGMDHIFLHHSSVDHNLRPGQ